MFIQTLLSYRMQALQSLIPLLLGSFLLVSSLPAQARSTDSTYQCDHSMVRVTSGSDRELSDICKGAQRAITFLARYQLKVNRAIHIHVVEHGINHNGYAAYASYNKRTDRIEIMSQEAIYQQPSPTMYGQEFDGEHYQAAVAHEMAHAISHQNSPLEDLSRSAQEYLAHATQLATLPEDYREKIIAEADIESWLPGDTISDIYMAMSPTKFAVKSYLHLTTTADPIAFVKIILNAKWMYVDAS